MEAENLYGMRPLGSHTNSNLQSHHFAMSNKNFDQYQIEKLHRKIINRESPFKMNRQEQEKFTELWLKVRQLIQREFNKKTSSSSIIFSSKKRSDI